jgi:CheY-like chemotaxis protein
VLLSDVVREAVDMSMPLVDGGKHALTVALPDATICLHADRHRVAQILSNLLNNAAKYTLPGGAIAIRAQVEGDEVAITVADNGIGIAANALDAVFDMYAQEHAGAQMAQGGLGVGLNLVQRLVKLHRGRVAAASDGAGQGSQFTVWLPLPEDGVMPPPEPEAEASVHQVALPGASTLRILVVDDNVDAAETLQALLEMNGHMVTAVHDGAAALTQAAALVPDVVFLDIGLPDMTGYEAAQAMRQIDGMAGATLIALTGWGAEQDRRRSSQAGFDHHLTKPADFGIVEQLIRDVAARK